ncbi:hypothetical protein KSP40_PGU010576 [Platanthera guangdongensis]|uniref:Uncharacterized protein n=1 Tax=Platanthera guangdongensis TaxID=2320717 RepID=A0ABR2MAL8_9ASPA
MRIRVAEGRRQRWRDPVNVGTRSGMLVRQDSGGLQQVRQGGVVAMSAARLGRAATCATRLLCTGADALREPNSLAQAGCLVVGTVAARELQLLGGGELTSCGGGEPPLGSVGSPRQRRRWMARDDDTQNMNESSNSAEARNKRTTSKGQSKMTNKKTMCSTLDDIAETSRIIGKCMIEPPRIQIYAFLYIIHEAISELETMTELPRFCLVHASPLLHGLTTFQNQPILNLFTSRTSPVLLQQCLLLCKPVAVLRRRKPYVVAASIAASTIIAALLHTTSAPSPFQLLELKGILFSSFKNASFNLPDSSSRRVTMACQRSIQRRLSLDIPVIFLRAGHGTRQATGRRGRLRRQKGKLVKSKITDGGFA